MLLVLAILFKKWYHPATRSKDSAAGHWLLMQDLEPAGNSANPAIFYFRVSQHDSRLLPSGRAGLAYSLPLATTIFASCCMFFIPYIPSILVEPAAPNSHSDQYGTGNSDDTVISVASLGVLPRWIFMNEPCQIEVFTWSRYVLHFHISNFPTFAFNSGNAWREFCPCVHPIYQIFK